MTVELGYANCNECGGENTKVLLIKERGIWSKCKRCGFVEWEWTEGDNAEYLVYLANQYHISYAEIIEALGVEDEETARKIWESAKASDKY